MVSLKKYWYIYLIATIAVLFILATTSAFPSKELQDAYFNAFWQRLIAGTSTNADAAFILAVGLFFYGMVRS